MYADKRGMCVFLNTDASLSLCSGLLYPLEETDPSKGLFTSWMLAVPEELH